MASAGENHHISRGNAGGTDVFYRAKTTKSLYIPSITRRTMDAVVISSLTKAFGRGEKKTVALSNVSLSIKKGEIFGLLGPNGAGKTTLISILCGLLTKDKGNVEILGHDLDTQLLAIQQKINLVFGFTGINMDLTVREFLFYYCLLYNMDDSNSRVSHAMEAVTIADKADVVTRDLSSGYKQRLLLAKALLNDPDVIFLDEPTVGLDVEIAIKIHGLIRNLQKQGKTILLTTHNMYEVEELCDRIALLSKGKIIALGTVGEIKRLIKVDKVIEVKVDHLETLVQAMAGQKYARSVAIVDDAVHIRVESYAHVKKVMAHLAKSNYHVYLVRLLEPTLEEAFIEIMKHQEHHHA